MATITLKGNTIHTSGNLPAMGSTLTDFTLTNKELDTVSTADLRGKKLVLNIFPSLDTGICAASVRRFNTEAASLKNTEVLCISADLPFAHSRFCVAEGIDKVHNLSTVRNKDFGKTMGLEIIDGPLEGLLSRSVIVVDGTGKVVYTEQVPEIAQEPDYAKALSAVSSAS
ncbi:MAG: thiol peroxidase [Spirochaetales bacterium]|nr:thiol peroxidase [Spirochaetales bacterium]